MRHGVSALVDNIQEIDTKLSAKIANMGFFCAVLIVALHVPFDSVLKSTICQMAVPCFFLMSGYLLVGHCDSTGWWKRAINKRLQSLILPYVAVNTIWFLYKVCLGGISLSFYNCTSALGLNLFVVPALGSMWYVRNLLLLVMISPLLVILCVWGGKAVGLVLIFLLFCVNYLVHTFLFNDYYWYMFFTFGFSTVGLVFFALGVFFRTNNIQLYPKKWVVIIAVISFCSHELFLGGGCIPMGALICVVWRFMPSVRWPKMFVENSFPLYIVHMIIIIHIRHLLPFINYQSDCAIAFYFCWVVTVVCSLLVISGIKRYLPFVSKICFGGR